MAAAVGAFLAALAIFIPSLSPDVSFADFAEAQTVPYILGIAHATGFPAYTLAGWLFTHLVVIGTVAWRANAFAALCVALCASGVAVLAIAFECNTVAVLGAALIFALGNVAWPEAMVANFQVPAVPAFIFALALSVFFARYGDRRTFYGACLCAGLGIAAHPLACFVVLGLVVAAAWQYRRFNARVVGMAALALLAPLLLYGYLPLRSAIAAEQHLDPNAAAPLYGLGSLDWDANQPRTLDGFLDEVLGRRDHASSALAHTLKVNALPSAFAFGFAAARREFPLGMLVLAAIGALALAQRDPRALSVVVAGGIGGLAFAQVYRADFNIDGYLLGSLAIVAALGAAATRIILPRLPPRVIPVAATASIVAFVVVAWFGPRSFERGAGYPSGRSAVDEARSNTPDGAIIVAAWPDATALAYALNVEKSFGSRTVVNGSPATYVRDYAYLANSRPVVLEVDADSSGELRELPVTLLRRLRTSSRSHLFYEIVPRTK